MRRLILCLLGVVLAGCGAQSGKPGERPPPARVDEIAAELEAMTGALTPNHPETFRSILADTIAKDSFTCLPRARDVFFGDEPDGLRTIVGEMPHYGLFFGPMHYRIERSDKRWHVRLLVGVVPPDPHTVVELPDCSMTKDVDEPTPCAEDPERATTLEACPKKPRGLARATDRTVRSLLRRFSKDAAEYWTRDARAEGLPIDYDFQFRLVTEADPSQLDIALPLAPTCGRTPYFTSIRAGWSLPIVAHEMGHVLGLLDEYETFSGMLYQKTPFPGCEVSRMGLSMREETKVLPVHHYLVLRRFFCAEPRESEPFRDVLR